MLFGTLPAPRRYRFMSQIVTPLAVMALLLLACDNTAPAPADPTPQTEIPAPAAEPRAPEPTVATLPDELPGPYFKTPAAGEELPTSQTTPGPVPLPYRFVWAIDRKDCTAPESLTRIAIAPGAVRSHHGRAVITAADEPHPGALVLQTQRLADSQVINETHTFALDADGKKLTYQLGDTSVSYIRCE